MGIRETLNKNPQIAMGLGGAILVLGLALLVWQLLPQSATAPRPGKMLFFTNDEGKTYFKADACSVPPFKHEGKDAVRAHVFKCEKGEPFVGWMERYKPDAKAKVEQFWSDRSNRDKYPPEFSQEAGREYMKRSSPKWLPWNSTEVIKLDAQSCRDGGGMAQKLNPNEP